MPDGRDVPVTVSGRIIPADSACQKQRAAQRAARVRQAGMRKTRYCRVSDCAALGHAGSLPQWPSQTRQRHS
jgi:hypothetical protein